MANGNSKNPIFVLFAYRDIVPELEYNIPIEHPLRRQKGKIARFIWIVILRNISLFSNLVVLYDP